MKSILMKAVGTLAMSGALIAAVPADARSWGNRSGYGDHRGSYGGARGYRNYGGGRGYWNRGYPGYYGYRVARGYPGYYRYGYYNDDAALALGVGILGVAIGAAIASDRHDHYDRYDDRYDRSYDDRSYDDRYYDDYYRR
jgi:hypothetical protein